MPSPDGVALEEFGARDVEVVNTLGAGDTFDAGFIAAALGGHSPRLATRWGVDLSAACVSSQETYAHLRRDMLDGAANGRFGFQRGVRLLRRVQLGLPA